MRLYDDPCRPTLAELECDARIRETCATCRYYDKDEHTEVCDECSVEDCYFEEAPSE